RHGIEGTFSSMDGRSCSARSLDDACVIGAAGAEPTWALVGDSHAATLGLSLHDALAARGWAGVYFTYPGCAYAQDLVRKGLGADPCLERNRQVRDRLLESDLKNILLVGRYTLYLEGKGFDNGEGGVEHGEDTYYEPVTAPANE